MKIIFWLAIAVEGIGLVYYIRKVLLLARQNQTYVYPEQYRQVLYPILVLSLLLIVSLALKFYFQSDRSATLVSLLPVILFVVALIGVVIGTILVGGRWH
ncbi:hypothetical protein SAMN05216327_101340 [Dyadobacter sp. SG02]|uniref:hypothetical protein n=1 Tax=Dyadobacter sp. SG02 TaxID=1855291 RepID=UPI0008C4FF55|nr:hypothetical protein [Dyadobacter sp. SG02]SEI41144.1 hypothetical protein SAMN05216327_101340 [Dyadobacter sp. SG02]